VKGILQIDQHLGVVILALGAKLRTASLGAAETATDATPAEQALEEVAEGRRIARRKTATAELEARIPVRRRPAYSLPRYILGNSRLGTDYCY
jgi:hypothetical protein